MARKVTPTPSDLYSLIEHLTTHHDASAGWDGYGYRDMQRVHKNEFHLRSGEAVDENLKGITPHTHKGRAPSANAAISAKAVVKKSLRKSGRRA